MLLAVPVVDIDGTIFLQGGMFLLMVFLLNGLLFRPWLEVRERRREGIEGALAQAERLQASARELGSRHDARLRDARERAQDIRSEAHKAAEGESARVLGDAREEARRAVAEAERRIASQAEQARTSLATRVDELAREIATKVLGRPA